MSRRFPQHFALNKEGAHGRLAGSVRVWASTHSLAIWIDGVLSPAEQATTQQPEGYDLMKQYAEQLLVAIRPTLWKQVETVTGRQIVSGHARADPDTAHALFFFILSGGPSETVSQEKSEN